MLHFRTITDYFNLDRTEFLLTEPNENPIRPGPNTSFGGLGLVDRDRTTNSLVRMTLIVMIIHLLFFKFCPL